MRYKEREKLHETETCARSRSRDSGAESLGVVKAKTNNMGQKYNTDRLLAASRPGIVRGLAIVSGRHAAEGGTGGGGWEGTPSCLRLSSISVSGYLARAWHHLTAHYILSFYLLLIHARHDETRYEGRARTNCLTPTAHHAKQPKKKYSAKVSSRSRFSPRGRETSYHCFPTFCPSHFNDARGASRPAPARVPHWGRRSLGSERDERRPAAASAQSNSWRWRHLAARHREAVRKRSHRV